MLKMEIEIFKAIGILGLVSIIIGTYLISSKRKIRRKKIYPFLLAGGIFLAIYSVYIKDTIFIVLQIVYIIVVIYDIIKLKQKRE